MKENKGFTLIELVIALALSGLIFTMLFTALWQTQKFREKGEERQETMQKMRILTDRLSWLLKGAYPYSIKEEGKTLIYFSGDSSTLGFVTSSVDAFSEGPEDTAGLKWVELSAGDEGLSIRENIYFMRENLDGEGGTERVFDPDVRSMEFSYLTIEESGSEKWVTEWKPKDKDYLPRAVRVKVGFEHKDKKFDLPEIVVRLRAGQ